MQQIYCKYYQYHRDSYTSEALRCDGRKSTYTNINTRVVPLFPSCRAGGGYISSLISLNLWLESTGCVSAISHKQHCFVPNTKTVITIRIKSCSLLILMKKKYSLLAALHCIFVIISYFVVQTMSLHWTFYYENWRDALCQGSGYFFPWRFSTET